MPHTNAILRQHDPYTAHSRQPKQTRRVMNKRRSEPPFFDALRAVDDNRATSILDTLNDLIPAKTRD